MVATRRILKAKGLPIWILGEVVCNTGYLVNMFLMAVAWEEVRCTLDPHVQLHHLHVKHDAALVCQTLRIMDAR